MLYKGVQANQLSSRMQVLSTRPSFVRAIYNFAARDGILSLWSGLTASILRQSTYSTARFALQHYFSEQIRKRNPSSDSKPSALVTMGTAGLAGGIAGLIGNPAEVVLVRMCADRAKAPSERFGYSNALSGLIRIGREDGMSAYFRGLGPNVVRSVLMSGWLLTRLSLRG